MDFIKINTEITASKSSLSKISKHLDTLTTAEGLPNHYEAVRGRLQWKKTGLIQRLKNSL